MRVNVYAAEISERMEIVTTVAENTGARFVGLRFYQHSADVLKPPLHPDDDSSAVTFWIESSRKGFEPKDARELRKLFQRAVIALDTLAEDSIQRANKELVLTAAYGQALMSADESNGKPN